MINIKTFEELKQQAHEESKRIQLEETNKFVEKIQENIAGAMVVGTKALFYFDIIYTVNGRTFEIFGLDIEISDGCDRFRKAYKNVFEEYFLNNDSYKNRITTYTRVEEITRRFGQYNSMIDTLSKKFNVYKIRLYVLNLE